MDVSVVGLGTVKFGRNQNVKYPQAFELPSDKIIQNLLNTAKELGINFLDTAPAYGASEERIGKLLTHRNDWVIMSKAGENFSDGMSHFDFSEKAIVRSVDLSLKKLRTDYLDMLLIHSNGEDEKIIRENQVFFTLDKLKRAGKIRASGMSTKTVAGGLLALQHSDVAMMTYRPDYLDEASVIQVAKEKNKSVIIKKAFASGHAVSAPQEILRFILAEPAVASVVVGTINLKHLIEIGTM